MSQYKILAKSFYTPPAPGLDVLQHIQSPLPSYFIVCVAIETHGGKWKAYIGFGYEGQDEDAAAQMVAGNGSKLTMSEACGHFPSLAPKDFTF